MGIYILIGLIVLIAIYVLIQYNSFIQLNNKLKEAISTMDIYLKKRFDLIPNLVEVVKGYTNYESSVLEKVIKLRTSSYDKASLSDKFNANTELSNELSNIMVVVEKYPDLKASQNFSDLMHQLSTIEDEIANSRKYYNAIVRNLNTKIEMFPSNLIAKMFNFKTQNMFETKEEEKNNIKVEL